jgi:hypothetical protein
MRNACLYGVAMTALLAVPLYATTQINVPEIDGSAISAGLGLLAAGVLVLRARWRRK